MSPPHIDALIEEAERGWVDAERTETARVSRRFTDQPHARRARRRAGRTVLRMLPDLLRLLPADQARGEHMTALEPLDGQDEMAELDTELRYVVDALARCLDDNERLRGELDAANDAVLELLTELDEARDAERSAA